MSYDVMVIGGGPAGLSAALNVRARGRSVLVVTNPPEENPLWKAERVDNYLGMPGVSGAELLEQLRRHAEAAGVEFRTGKVLSAMPMEDTWYLSIGTDMEHARALVLAAGVNRGKKFPGETEFLGRGVSYCATCDGMFYKDKRIAVICNDKKYEHEVKYLADLAAEVLYFPTYNDSEIELPNVKISKDAPIALIGDSFVEGITLRSGKTESVDGVFCLRNAIAPSKLMPQLEIENGHILVDRAQQTNVAGCFAAGDCTGRPYQYTKAVGEGNVAAHSCIQYLSKSEK